MNLQCPCSLNGGSFPLVVVVVCLYFCQVGTLGAWSERGHHLVARLAEAQMTPSAVASVRRLLNGQSLADVSMWADQIKPSRPETAVYHYANFPARHDQEPFDAQGDNDGAVVPALERSISLLGQAHLPAADRAEALRFVVHLVGDVHQPLHCAPQGDQGGNKITVRFFGRPRNLHQVWDRDILDSAGISEDIHFAALQRIMAEELTESHTGLPQQWAAESNRLAVWQAYRIPWNGCLDERYVEPSLRLANRQLIKAGRRLAAVLNDAFSRSEQAGEPAIAHSTLDPAEDRF
ncbi:MAG TPA: S1/P1 nuclease [Candidatus Ozemobacteraceae bacterium]|nr:S1/P1 nuclease [Candidatus Ozemobacteraceae bacterium]